MHKFDKIRKILISSRKRYKKVSLKLSQCRFSKSNERRWWGYYGADGLNGKSFSSEIADVITALELYLLREWKKSQEDRLKKTKRERNFGFFIKISCVYT